jgi:predicted amidohydrolase
MRIAFYQFSPVFGDVEANRGKIAEVLKSAQADLIALPELATSGYLFTSREEVKALAEPIPGPTTEFLWQIARESGMHIVIGLPERDGDALYNSAALVGPQGVVAHYRKAHLFYEEKLYFRPGDRAFPICKVQDAKVGLLICYDHMFPEAARTLALQGVQLIVHPSNLVMPGKGQFTSRVRALENRVFWVLANRWGAEERDGKRLQYTGESQIVAPDGSLFAEAPSEGDALEIVEVDPLQALDKHVTKLNDLFEDRRPELYEL